MSLRENKKFLVGFVLFFMVILLAACGGEATSTSAPATTAPATTAATTAAVATTRAAATVPATTAASSATTVSTTAIGGLTMKEAYALVEPQMKAWQEDRVLFSIFNTLDSGIGINPDGKSAQWNFQAVSAKVSKRATFLVKADKEGKTATTVTKTGEETLSAAEAKATPALPPVNSLIDSNQLMSVAKQNGGDKSDSPVGFFLRQPIKEGEPLAVDLVFYKGNDVVRLRIDMQSGKIVQNDKG